MIKQQEQVKNWMQRFGQATPDKPEVPSLEVRKLRAKIELEECLEKLVGLGFGTISDDYGCVMDIDEVLEALRKNKTLVFVEDHTPNLVEIADGCADSQFVNIGTAVACGIEMEEIWEEVVRSNNSKLWTGNDISIYKIDRTASKVVEFDGYKIALYVGNDKWLVKNKDGKIMKSPSYSPANIASIIEAQQKK